MTPKDGQRKRTVFCTGQNPLEKPRIAGRFKRQKIIIVWFAYDMYDPRVIHACSNKGKQLTLTQCVIPDKRMCKGILYSDGKGHFFSLCGAKLTEVFDTFSPTNRTKGRHCFNGKRGNDYPCMRNFGCWSCHKIVLLTFKGERPVGDDGIPFQGDHKNGDVTDYSIENLEWVHPSENAWRSIHVLRVLRVKGINPTSYSGKQMDLWFALFRAYEIAGRKPIQISAEDILSDFEHSCLEDPAKQIEREMTRHMEV
jgi:hypothetical protein